MEPPKIIKADSSNVEKVKSAITLGFAADPFLRWFFPERTTLKTDRLQILE